MTTILEKYEKTVRIAKNDRLLNHHVSELEETVKRLKSENPTDLDIAWVNYFLARFDTMQEEYGYQYDLDAHDNYKEKILIHNTYTDEVYGILEVNHGYVKALKNVIHRARSDEKSDFKVIKASLRMKKYFEDYIKKTVIKH